MSRRKIEIGKNTPLQPELLNIVDRLISRKECASCGMFVPEDDMEKIKTFMGKELDICTECMEIGVAKQKVFEIDTPLSALVGSQFKTTKTNGKYRHPLYDTQLIFELKNYLEYGTAPDNRQLQKAIGYAESRLVLEKKHDTKLAIIEKRMKPEDLYKTNELVDFVLSLLELNMSADKIMNSLQYKTHLKIIEGIMPDLFGSPETVRLVLSLLERGVSLDEIAAMML
jgi:hypothetical protein